MNKTKIYSIVVSLGVGFFVVGAIFLAYAVNDVTATKSSTNSSIATGNAGIYMDKDETRVYCALCEQYAQLDNDMRNGTISINASLENMENFQATLCAGLNLCQIQGYIKWNGVAYSGYWYW